ncbi:MAG: beta-Ala-His dipeptidase [Spirochaetia bacterium]|nr:beta-Ala-His dipeptidase [Spirochaetia bacterium]
MNNKTEKILKLLDDINKVPRKSENMVPIHNYFRKWADDNNFSYKADDALNLAISVPASDGFEKSPVIILQGHMDMVCEKIPESNHDFSRDPVVSFREGDWLKAKETSLGADNAIALAMAMVIASDPEIKHPPLELLFTTDEEIGMGGAERIKPEFLKGKILINLDSEETGVFTAGCAGSSRTCLDFKLKRESVPAGSSASLLKIGGFKGGHSAGDAAKSRANGCFELIRGLSGLGKVIPFTLTSIDGGSAMNAIPRSAEALIVFDAADGAKVKKWWKDFSDIVIKENSVVEKNAFLSCEEKALPADTMTLSSTGKVINSLRIMPNGIKNMDAALPDQIETSLNFAMIKMITDGVRVTSMQRSSVKSRLIELTERIEDLASLTGAEYKLEVFTDPWQPDWESPLLKRSTELWKKIHGEEPKVEITHGGLECGVIGNICGGMDTLSFGPDIENPHSPDERLKISSVAKVFDFLVELLLSYRQV